MQIEPLSKQKYISNNQKQGINKTLKGVLVNNHFKTQDNISFDEIQDSLLICDNPESYSKNTAKYDIEQDKKESSFDAGKAIKPLLAATAIIVGGTFLLSSIIKKSSKTILKSKSFEQLPDLAVNMNIKEEPQFAIYRAIRDPNYKNIIGAASVIMMSAVTIGCKNFVDGAKEIWIKKQSADIEKNLQENLIEIETNAFSGKLQTVNNLMAQNVEYFDRVLNKDSSKSSDIFKGFVSFKSQNLESKHQKQSEPQKPNKKFELNKNVKYVLLTLGVLTGAVLLGKFSISNLKKTVNYTQKYANECSEKTIDAIKNISEKANKDDIPRVVELMKSICAKPEFIEEVGKKYKMSSDEINTIKEAVNTSKKTIFADAPTALGGIPKKIQYYCYIDENRGHLYNWILNPENKFTKYIFGAFTLSSAIGYVFKQGMDAVKEVTVQKENAKTELDLRKRLVDVEIRNFKSKKESAINPLLENFDKQLKEGKKSKEELKQLADNILTETKNGPPYVYT